MLKCCAGSASSKVLTSPEVRCMTFLTRPMPWRNQMEIKTLKPRLCIECIECQKTIGKSASYFLRPKCWDWRSLHGKTWRFEQLMHWASIWVTCLRQQADSWIVTLVPASRTPGSLSCAQRKHCFQWFQGKWAVFKPPSSLILAWYPIMDCDNPEYIGWYNANYSSHQATGVLNTGQVSKTLRIKQGGFSIMQPYWSYWGSGIAGNAIALIRGWVHGRQLIASLYESLESTRVFERFCQDR